MHSFRLAVQNFTLRDCFAADFGATVGAISGTGLRACETAGLVGLTAPESKLVFDQHEVQPVGAHWGLDSLEGDFDSVVLEARTLGYRYVVVPWIGADVFGAGWAGVAGRLNSLGDRYRADGLELLYHNHSFEFDLENGRPGYDILVEGCRSFGFELDVYWCFAAGHDPATVIDSLLGRIPLVHLKDGIRGQKPEHVPCGQGEIDWEPVLSACDRSGVEFGIIELDESAIPPIEAVRQSVDFFRSKGVAF